jgi:hypothetical protein
VTLTYVSLGAGAQSSALLVCSALGLHGVPKAAVAIFADTGDEPAWVYEQVKLLRAWAEPYGIPVETVSIGCLSADTLDRHKGGRTRFAAIPAFTSSPGGGNAILRRQCTREYKIEPIERKVRELLGYRKRQRIPKGAATALIGISREEATRMKPSRTPWITSAWPLVDANLRRADCVRILAEHGLPEPKKSACVFCPFHSDTYWAALKSDHPAEFERAAHFDEQIRDMSKSGVKGQVFLHRKLIPLRAIDFEEIAADKAKQMDFGFGSECEGVCGV